MSGGAPLADEHHASGGRGLAAEGVHGAGEGVPVGAATVDIREEGLEGREGKKGVRGFGKGKWIRMKRGWMLYIREGKGRVS